MAGVVTETGGFLAHAAVICRELGIPAVPGVPGPTRRIADGAAGVLRGSEGQVELAGRGRDEAGAGDAHTPPHDRVDAAPHH